MSLDAWYRFLCCSAQCCIYIHWMCLWMTSTNTCIVVNIILILNLSFQSLISRFMVFGCLAISVPYLYIGVYLEDQNLAIEHLGKMCVLMTIISYAAPLASLVSKSVTKLHNCKKTIFCWKSTYNIDGIKLEMYARSDSINNVTDMLSTNSISV